MAHLYKVNEIFYSLQGEGVHTGIPSVFVRFSGCNRQCTFCDTDFERFTPMTLAQIVDAVTMYPARRVVLTGGEPMLQVDDALISALHDNGIFIQIETNGTLDVPDTIDWVTCSPKDPAPAITPSRVNELKVVYQGQNPQAVAERFPDAVWCLQPCSCRNTRETVEYVMTHPRWRLSLQTHKMIDIP